LVLKKPVPGKMSRKAFRRILRSVDPPFVDRARVLETYYSDHVFAPESWGTLLRSFRDKVAHQDRLVPSRQGVEVILGIRLDWPTVQNQTLERFAQEFENGVFQTIRGTAEIAFDKKWPA
ncbi:MAG TPA: hypothetical protein VF039_00345, partial [Longimicrobiales bacterium]